MKLPIDQVQKVIEASGEALADVYALMHGGGLLNALSIMNDLSILKTIDQKLFVAELKDLDPVERASLLIAFKTKFQIADKVLQAKIDTGSDYLDEAVSIGLEAYNVVEQTVSLVNRVKGLFQ